MPKTNMNVAWLAVKQFTKDKKYLQVIEPTESEVLYKGKDLDKVWEYATCTDEVYIEVYETTKKFLGFMHVLHEKGYDHENVKDYSGDYVFNIVDEIQGKVDKRVEGYNNAMYSSSEYTLGLNRPFTS